MEEVGGKTIPRFNFVTKEEEKAFIDGTWNPNIKYELDEMPYGFYFLDLPLEVLRRYFKSWFENEEVDKLIKPFYLEDNGNIFFSKQLLTTAVFIILHEYGHYLDYKRFSSK